MMKAFKAIIRNCYYWGYWRLLRLRRRWAIVDRKPKTDTSDVPLHIAYITVRVTPRQLKLAHAARLRGLRVTLLTVQAQISRKITQHFDASHQLESPRQAWIWLAQNRPDITHLFVNTDTKRLLPILLYSLSPVIYDPYDCLQGMLRPEILQKGFLKAERICFAKAAHICARNLEPLYLRRQWGYRMPATTFFPEYCWHTPRVRESRQVGADDELHLVYCGGVWPEDRYPESTHGYAQYIDVARALAEQRIHLHIYPANVLADVEFEEFYALYLREDQRLPYLHFYHPLPYEELLDQLTRYDAAIHVMGVTVNQNVGHYTQAQLDYSSANKLFDYMEAGLPVVIHNGRLQSGIIRHYGTIVQVNNIKQVRQALQAALSQPIEPQPSVSIEAHAARFEAMYRAVVK